jgi:hypothetical protein
LLFPVGIVLYGTILFHNTQQTSGGAPKDDFQRRLKVSFLFGGRFTMLFATLMIMLGVIGDMELDG